MAFWTSKRSLNFVLISARVMAPPPFCWCSARDCRCSQIAFQKAWDSPHHDYVLKSLWHLTWISQIFEFSTRQSTREWTSPTTGGAPVTMLKWPSGFSTSMTGTRSLWPSTVHFTSPTSCSSISGGIRERWVTSWRVEEQIWQRRLLSGSVGQRYVQWAVGVRPEGTNVRIKESDPD